MLHPASLTAVCEGETAVSHRSTHTPVKREVQEAVCCRGPGLWVWGPRFVSLLLTDLVTSVESRTQSKPSSHMLGVAVVVPVMSNSGNTGLRALEKVRICEEPCPAVPYRLQRAVVPTLLPPRGGIVICTLVEMIPEPFGGFPGARCW